MVHLNRWRAFPQPPLAQYTAAVMWPLPMTGVISQETALDLQGLSDANPSKIHLTLPTSFRIRRRVIPRLYVLHKSDLKSDEVTTLEGIPITTPVRTIRDCQETHVGPAILRQAIEDGRRTGKLSAAAAEMLMRELGPSTQFALG